LTISIFMAPDQTLDFVKRRSGTAVDIRSDTYVKTSLLLRANDRVERVDNFLSGVQHFLLEDDVDFKIF
jgi:hypothetical protein